MTKLMVIGGMLAASLVAGAAERTISLEDYRDKMKAAWIGQMYGVAWGFPTEFKFVGDIVPEDKVPTWTPEFFKKWTYGNDDLYVEMTFLRTLEKHGLNVTSRQAGIDFANTRYPLWCANNEGRRNLRRGIAGPDCSHPKFHASPNDIDYQIEADYSGIIAPGCPQEVIHLGEVFGRLVNYGDGMWAGQFVGALYAEAFFTSDIDKLLDAGLAAIPAESDYAQMVRNVRAWHKEYPNDWQKCWEKIRATYSAKYNRKIGNKDFVLKGVSRNVDGEIDVRLNGACIVLGLLYSEGDPEKGMLLSMRCGWDSDCNPSNVGGIMLTMRGFKALPEKYKNGLNDTTKFSFTNYDTPALLDVCEKLARQIVVKNGGRIVKGADGKDQFVIPVKKPTPSAFTPSWQPAPPTEPKGARYTKEEMTANVQKALDEFYPGWKTSTNGVESVPGLVECVEAGDLEISTNQQSSAFVRLTAPAKDASVTLSRRLKIPAGKSKLYFEVGSLPIGGTLMASDLTVRVDGEDVMTTALKWNRPENKDHGGFENLRAFDISLKPWAGREVTIEIVSSGVSMLWRNFRIDANK